VLKVHCSNQSISIRCNTNKCQSSMHSRSDTRS